ncbi:terminase small subunit [Desulfobacula sp.]|uniref:terminase small subunit n=1 Tax=Desulfobacula sp. TaxID=2593537 RepID=UPI00260EBAFD|nr:terminase small subunit [Desulfobacula sp.]
MSKAKQVRALSPLQLLFCKEYIIDFNATQSAIRAGYSKKTAYSQGQRLLKNVEIQKELARLMASRSKRLDITADRVLLERARLAFYQVRDLYHEDGTLKDILEIDDDLGAAINEVSIGVKTVKNEKGEDQQKHYIRKIKMIPKDKSLEALEKHLGTYKKDNEQKGNADLKTKQEFMEALLQSIAKSDRGLPKE